MFEKVLVKILHYTVFDTLAVEHIVIFFTNSFIGLIRKDFIKLIDHLSHQILYLNSLLLSRTIGLKNSRQTVPNEVFNGLSNR